LYEVRINRRGRIGRGQNGQCCRSSSAIRLVPEGPGATRLPGIMRVCVVGYVLLTAILPSFDAIVGEINSQPISASPDHSSIDWRASLPLLPILQKIASPQAINHSLATEP
jgi:hypothetical protein